MKVMILAILIVFGITPSFSEDIPSAAAASGLPSLRAAAKPEAVMDSDEEEKDESSASDPAQLITRTYAAVKSACQAFEELILEEELSGIMELTLKQVSDDPELTKNAQFNHYKKILLDVIPQIALDIQRYIKGPFPSKKLLEKANALEMSPEAYFELFLREECSITKIYSVWKKMIEELEASPTVDSGVFAVGDSGTAIKPKAVTGFDGSDKTKGWQGCFDNHRQDIRVTRAGGKSAHEAMERLILESAVMRAGVKSAHEAMKAQILENDVTHAKVKSACEAFERLISDNSLSWIMDLTLKQISGDPELTKNTQFDHYKNTLLDVIPQIALELAGPHLLLPVNLNQLIREKILLIEIYTTWKKLIEEIETE